MKNCLHALSAWIFCFLTVGIGNPLYAQNVRDGFCDYSRDITCGIAATNQTTAGAQNVVWDYPQCNNYTFSGPEKVYRFTTTTSGTIQIDLTIHKSYLDLDLLLLADNCSTPTCLAQSITSNANGRTEQIVYNNASAGTYYIIVDSEKDVGAFDLLVTCPTTTTPSCNLEYTVSPHSISCGASKGAIGVDISWGKGPFKIEWDNTSNSVWDEHTTSSKNYTIQNLPAGTYTVKVTDMGASNCTIMKNGIQISNSGGDLQATFSATDAPCGSYFGWINVDVANSSPPYWITIKGPKSGTAQGNTNNSVIKDMPPGNYEVTVEKDNCTKTGWVTVGAKENLDFTSEITHASCGSKGSFWITVQGGSPTYILEWWHKNGGSDWVQSASRSFSLENMKSGEYTIKVTDKNGCSKTKKLTISGGAELDFALESNAASCSDKGSIWVTIKNGSPTYTVEWSGPSGSNWIHTNQKDFAIDDLKAGTYTILITDKNHCKRTKQITVGNQGGQLDFELEANAGTCGSKGAIWVTVKNGSPTYTVEWWGPNISKWAQAGSNSFKLKDLPSGDYTVKITDKNGCSNTKTIWIDGGSDGLDFELETLGASCSNAGSIWITVKNGSPNFSVDITGNNGVTRWFSADQKGMQVTDLPAGYYTVDITDKNGCKGTRYINVHDKGGKLDFELEANAANCGKKGAIWVTVKEGSPKFVVELWGPNNTSFWGETNSRSFQLKDLGAGSYTIKITDKNGCSNTKSVHVSGGSSNLGLDLEVNNAGCSSDGRIWVTIQGGYAPYHLTWDGPVWGDVNTNSKGYQINNLKAGTYTVKVKDGHGCTFSKVVSVYGSPSNLKLELESTSASCDRDGSSWVTIRNGKAPYQVSWTGPRTGNMNTHSNSFSLNNLSPGTYTVSVKDANGCIKNGQVTINKVGGNLSFSLEANNGSCGQKGNIWVTMNSGTGPYHITWAGPLNGESSFGNNGYQIPNLPAGWYKVKIKDKNGCLATKDIEVKGGTQFSLQLQQTEAKCNGDGQIWLDMFGGTSPFSITLSGPMVGSTVTDDHQYHFTKVPKGDYTLTVVDKTGCTVTKNIKVTGVANNINLAVEKDNSICGQGGAAWITLSGGKANYTLSWSGPVSGTAITSSNYQLTNLPSGNYTLKATDANGCHVEKSITINDTGNSLALSLEATNASCGQLGSIWVTLTGGTANYNIAWTGPSSGATQSSNTGYSIANLNPGTYTVTVKDSKGCQTQKSITVSKLGGNLSVDVNTASNVACEHDGSVVVTMHNGTAPFSINYTGPTSGTVQTSSNSQTIAGLKPGDYNFNVTDKNGCTATKKIRIYDTGTDLAIQLTANDASCGGKGSIGVAISGGVANYKVTWHGGGVSNSLITGNKNLSLTDLPIGTYTVKVKDGIGCTKEATVNVNSVGGNVGVQLQPKNDVCGQGGSIDVIISGGKSNYQISWSGPTSGSAQSSSSTFKISGLAPGNYTVDVKDANGCTAKEWVAVNTGGAINFGLTAANVECNKNGSIQVDISSGAPNYTITWSGPKSGSTTINTNIYKIDDLGAGTYTITVKDSKGCVDTKSISLHSNSSNLGLSLTNANATCGEANGTITATVTGGQGEYTYSWSGPVNGSEKLNANTYTVWDVPAGTYTLSVVDKNGCTASKSIAVSNAVNALGLSAVAKNASCGQPSSIQVTISNGAPDFKIEWTGPANGSITTSSNSHNITDLPDGEYIVRVTDKSNCTKAQAVIIKSEGNNINFTYEAQDATCDKKGAIWLTIVDGKGPYNVSWTGPNTGSSTTAETGVQITDLQAGTYVVTVKDNNGCVISQTIEVKGSTTGTNVNFAHKPGAVTCNELGNILLTMISGTAPYTVSWAGPTSGTRTASTTDIRIENLQVGVYTVSVSDAGNCGVRTESITIEDKKVIIGVNGTITNGVCGGKGSVNLSWSGDRDPYTISWTGPQSGSIAVNSLSHTVTDLKDGQYTFKVKGFDGCEGEYQATINNGGNTTTADFSYTISGKKLVFTNASTAGTYAWDFGDNNTSTEMNPTHTYDKNGTYNICLKVSNSCGTDEKCQSVTINAVNSQEQAKILLGDMAGPKGVVLQLPVQIKNCSRLATLSGTISMGNDQVAKINGISPNIISPIYNDDNHSFSYLSPGLGMDVDSSMVLFYINVELTGGIGQSSSIDLSSLPVALELTCTEDGLSSPITPEVGSGRVTISSQLKMANVIGNVTTNWGDGIAEAMVAIEGQGHESYPMTTADGDYKANEVPMGYEYQIKPSKNSNPSNGLSTFGIYLTQKYILGYQPEEIVSPYQVIAMDANCSGTLTTYDVFVMQQLLVGNITEFPNCNSWVFVDATHKFEENFDAKNVFPFADSHTMMLDKDNIEVDFIGVKVGDVLGRAIPNDAPSFHIASDRNRKVLPLQVAEQSAEKGEVISLDFSMEEFKQIVSFQLGLNFDAQKLEFMEFLPNENKGLASSIIGGTTNQLKISWYHPDGEGLSLADTEKMFTLKFKAKEAVKNIKDLLQIDNRGFSSELHNESQEAYQFGLETVATSKDVLFKVHQNRPNPFNEVTTIMVEMPYAQEASISIHNHLGHEVKIFKQQLEKGMNAIELNRGNLSAGMYYYTVKTGTLSATKPLLIIEK
jgi:uncharacterized protein (DUF2141 family)